MPEPNPPEKKHLSNRALRLWLDYVYQEQDRTGSYATRQARESHLRIFVQTIYDSGYNPKPKNTRPKHIELALTNWAEGDIARRTIDNRISTLRWFAAEIGKPNIVKRTNDEYKMLPPREKPNYTDKARSLDRGSLDKVRDPLTHMSLILQREFGLRQKEAIMIRPHEADRGNRIHLQDSWAKGGKARDVRLTTPGQRQALDEAKALVPPGRALIPSNKEFHQQRRVYKNKQNAPGSQTCTAYAMPMPNDATERLPDDSIQTEKGGTVPQEADYPKRTFPKKTTRSTSRRA